MSEVKDSEANEQVSVEQPELYHSRPRAQHLHEHARARGEEEVGPERVRLMPAEHAAAAGHVADPALNDAVGSSPWLRWPPTVAAVVALVISVSPTLYDFIYVTLPSAALDHVAVLGMIAILGLLVTWGISGYSAVASQLHVANWGGLTGGLLIGLGLGLMRVAHTEERREIAFALFLTAVEIWGIKIWHLCRAYSANMDYFRTWA